jgi:hypothetical protein
VAAGDDEQPATVVPKKRLVAVPWLAGGGVEEAGEVQAHLQADQLAGEFHRANTTRTAKPIETPISTCCSTSMKASGESSGTGHRPAARLRASAMKPASATRTRIGTVRWPSTGSVAEQRQHAQERPQQRRDPARICASVKVRRFSRQFRPTDRAGDGLQRALQVFHQRGQHPRPGHGQHRHRGHHLGHEAQRGLVDLRGGLEDADQQADHQHRQQHRRDHHQQQHQALLAG